MTSPLKSLIASGTKLWIDSIDPELVLSNFKLGATGATSNPIIVANIIKTGRFDKDIRELKTQKHSSEDIAWILTDRLVTQAEEVFSKVYHETKGNDGYVSFEVDPLLEDLQLAPAIDQRIQQYVNLAKKWAAQHPNRLIKIPATEAGLASLEEVVASGINVNVTLIFSERQYQKARDAVWRGAQKRDQLKDFKSVYSIFVSRLDVYAEKKYPDLSEEAQGLVGILNAKRIWQKNKNFWADKKTPLEQEMIFASTGTKSPKDPKWKYVHALAGSDIETNPPETNEAVEASGISFQRMLDQLPAASIIKEIDQKVNWEELEYDLMREGLSKFADPQKALLKLIENT